ncbi:MAG: FtsX-like permease family protein [Bacteroidota bacterium]
MFTNYVKVALRSITKNKVYSALNIFGLAIGFTCSIIIFLFVFDELSFDKFHEKSKNIHRLGCIYYLPNNAGSEINATMGPVVGERMVDDYPEVLQQVRIQVDGNKIIEKPSNGDRFFEEVYLADSNIFQLFTFPLAQGNPLTALTKPFTMVISKNAAMKYFNSTDIIGQSLFMPEDSIQFEITGILEDLPPNSHLQFDFLGSLQTRYAMNEYMTGWWNFNTYTYLELEQNTDVAALTDKVKFISRNYIADQEDGSGYRQEYFFQNIEDVHLYSDLRYEISENSKASYVYIFMVVGIFILVIASINFMNLATARSAMRAKEVGLRKVVGAYRNQLVAQFLGESMIITLIALLISMVATALGIEAINEFTGKALTLSPLDNPFLFLFLVGVSIFVGLFSGSYPALFLSGFQPVTTLKGNFKGGRKSNLLRKFLVVFQFTISVVLITGTVVVFNQLDFMRNKDLGFEKERIIAIPTKFVNNALRDFTQLRDRLTDFTQVKGASISSRVPGRELNNNVVRLGWDDEAEWSDMRYLAVDYDFIDNYELKLVAGRGFDESYGTDENEAFILNQSGMLRLGWTDPEEALGKQLRWQNRRGYVIGVVEDFHFMSVNRAIDPFIMVMNGQRRPGYLSVKLQAEQYAEAIDLIEAQYREVMPNGIFEYEFLDQDYDKQYQADQKFMTVFTFFTIVAILVACLGLYGLASFTAELRIKEIGIRKALGASVKQVIVLMSTEFSKLVLVAIFISIPFAYWGLTVWLDAFPYKTELHWWIFAVSGALAILIAWLTISSQSIKAALINPVDSIAQE